MSADHAVHVRIEGRVQGVGYRAWTEATAVELGLKGWARNRRDGAVEAVFQGEKGQVEEMLRRCERGPRHASVERVELIGDGVGAFQTFAILPTE